MHNTFNGQRPLNINYLLVLSYETGEISNVYDRIWNYKISMHFKSYFIKLKFNFTKRICY